ncbi:substrate-binding periplasmic protein [Thalassomonas haliotis]|uniref:Transporter substrate-binding domain-containing protein n=1 Tax=Thalassomonas haliotis TaxID=485448 RepID=A0ABY7VMH2_9GAMM|nr:transporter substrate-binding domain-containing protein [Thalassomonas haliotis]WDE14185.1 transporter substrate-binding domain-containing protein [Thalassomonas haliotis]
MNKLFPLILLPLLALSAGIAYPQTPVAIATGEYPPFTAQHLYQGGFIHHVIRQAFATQGYKVSFSYFPWKRNISLARRGKFQASAYWVCEPPQSEDFFCSEPLYTGTSYLYFLKQHPVKNWSDLQDLAAYHLGITRGYEYTEPLWQAVKSGRIKADIVNTDQQNIEKLLAGRVDVIILGHLEASVLFREKFTEAEAALIGYHPKPFQTASVHLLFPKVLANSLTLQGTFNKGLTQLRLSGKLSQYQENLKNGRYGSNTFPLEKENNDVKRP